MAKKRPERAIPLFRKHSYLYSRTDFERIAMLAQRPRRGWRQRHGGAALPYLREFADDELAGNLPGNDNLPEDIIKVSGIAADALNQDGIFPIVAEGADGYYPGSLTRCCRIRYSYPTNAYLAADFLVPSGGTELWWEVMYNLNSIPNSCGYAGRLSDDTDFASGTETYGILDQYNRVLLSGLRVNGSATNTSNSGTGFSSIAAGEWWSLQGKLDPVNELLWLRVFRRNQFMWNNAYAGWRSWAFPRADWPSAPQLTYIIGGFAPYVASSGSYYLGRLYVGLPEHEWPTSEPQKIVNFDDESTGGSSSKVTVPADSGSWTVQNIPSDSNSYAPPGFSHVLRSSSTTASPLRFYFPLATPATGCLRIEMLAYVSYSGMAAAYLRGGIMESAGWPPKRRIGMRFGRNAVGSYEWISGAYGIYDVTGTTSETYFDPQNWTSTSPMRADWNRWMLYIFELDSLYSKSGYGEQGRIQCGVRRKQDGVYYPVVMPALYPPVGWTGQGDQMSYFFFEFDTVDTDVAYVNIAQISVSGDGYDYPMGAKV